MRAASPKLAFKEDWPDLRNSKVIDIVNEFKRARYVVVSAFGQKDCTAIGARKIRNLAKKVHVLYDFKYLFARVQIDGRL